MWSRCTLAAKSIGVLCLPLVVQHLPSSTQDPTEICRDGDPDTDPGLGVLTCERYSKYHLKGVLDNVQVLYFVFLIFCVRRNFLVYQISLIVRGTEPWIRNFAKTGSSSLEICPVGFYTSRQDKHDRVVLVPLLYILYQCILDQSLLTRYQKHTAMYNWSHCIYV